MAKKKVERVAKAAAVPAPEPDKITVESGTSGLKQGGGVVREEFLRELSGTRAIKVYREMADNDAVVGGVLFAIDMLIRGVEWRVQPASQEDADKAAAKFVEGCLGDMSTSWGSIVSEALSFLTYGWSFHEIVYKRRLGPKIGGESSTFSDGLYGWKKLPGRAQDTLSRWDFDESGGLRGMFQLDPNTGRELYVPIEKGLLFRTMTQKNNPEGKSILRNAWRSWTNKKRIENIEAVGIERDLAGLPVAYLPTEYLSKAATASQRDVKAKLEKIVKNIRRDEQEGLLFPLAYDDQGRKKFDITLLTTGGRRQFDVDATIRRYDSRIAGSVLADFILLGQDQHGSFALSSDKTSLFAVAIGTYLDAIAEVINRHAIPRLFTINGWAPGRHPTLTHGDIESVDVQGLSTFVSQLVSVGAITVDDEVEDALRKAGGLPTKTRGEVA